MFELQSLLTAIDLDETAGRVIESATQLGSMGDGTRQFLCHCVDPISAVYERLLFPYACYGDDREAVLAELLQRAEDVVADRFRDNRGSLGKHTLKLAYGKPSQAVLEEAESIGPDMIVVGATSESGAGARRLGREATEIAARSRVPVLIVRRRSGAPTFRKVAVAVDLAADSAHLMEQAMAFCNLASATLAAVHVIPSCKHMDHASYMKSDAGADKALKQKADGLFRKVASNMKLSFPLRQSVEEVLQKPSLRIGDPGEELVAELLEREPDVIVMQKSRATAGSGLRLGRVAEYVSRNAPCDVLLVPPQLQRASV